MHTKNILLFVFHRFQYPKKSTTTREELLEEKKRIYENRFTPTEKWLIAVVHNYWHIVHSILHTERFFVARPVLLDVFSVCCIHLNFHMFCRRMPHMYALSFFFSPFISQIFRGTVILPPFQFFAGYFSHPIYGIDRDSVYNKKIGAQ